MDNPIALVTGANQGVGLEVATKLAAASYTVYVGSRNLKRAEEAVKTIAGDARPLQLDVTDRVSIASASERIHEDSGHLHLLVNNAAISNVRKTQLGLTLAESAKLGRASVVSIDEVKAIWETNVFGVLAVYQQMLPLLRKAPWGRVVNVSSGVGSLTTNSDPAFAYRAMYAPGYSASKTALNGITLAMMIELEGTSVKVNLVSPGFTSTNLNGFEGTESIADGSREVVRVALLGKDGPTGTFTRWNEATIPW